jgi:hypothetical protein
MMPPSSFLGLVEVSLSVFYGSPHNIGRNIKGRRQGLDQSLGAVDLTFNKLLQTTKTLDHV